MASTPYLREGPLWDAYSRYFGQDDPRVLVWVAPSRAMNPFIEQSEIDDAYRRDPVSAASEWDAQFRDAEGGLVSSGALARVMRPDDAPTRPVHEGASLVFVDAASGSGEDSFAVRIAVRTPEGKAHVVAVGEHVPPRLIRPR